ncbi:MAG: hypothetical protein COY80_00590 [Candidatus Pacebacteria bacterium CG_4_10_14_0_8_um_filter_42_14]|nr:MAG: hypothetical protein COY80_00590 [Candidatus Pacebacteria bacterium CG_4_10_14_0_8_um_filter_42_14]
MFFPSKKSSQSGYVAVITLLVMVVLLSLGLSLANQATQEISLAGNESEQVRVFNAAEAALDTLLADPASYVAGAPDPLTLSSNGVNETIIGSEVTSGDLTSYFPQGSTATIDLSSSTPGTITIDWEKTNTDCNSVASLLVAIYSDDGSGNYSVRYSGIKPESCATSSDGPSGFIKANQRIVTDYKNFYEFGVLSGDKLMRIKVLLKNTDLSVSGAGIQQHTAQAMATGDTDGVTSVIQGTRSIPAAPAIFDYALYSGGSIVKAN